MERERKPDGSRLKSGMDVEKVEIVNVDDVFKKFFCEEE